VHGRSDVLIYADSSDEAGVERLSLHFGNAADLWCSRHLKTARPGLTPIETWPTDIALARQFSRDGPSHAEIGVGTPIHSIDTTVVPIVWCCFYGIGRRLLLYADAEIPLNVGIMQADDEIIALQNSARAMSVLRV
jgi:hypothetical protein